RTLLQQSPDHPDCWVAKAQLELSTGRWHEAAASIRTVVDRDPELTQESTKRAIVLAQAAYERFESAHQ
ncbi:MAG: hypothetical protein AAFQ82_18140, partial [Myxococcota bacterium]